MRRLVLVIGVLGIGLWMSACMQAPDTPWAPEPTATATPTLTPTPTVIWFPPTSTPTAFSMPAITATVESLPIPGELLFSDDFSNESHWSLGQTRTTSIALGNHSLTLALDQPDGYIYTLRNSPTLDDFYLEVTASPSLCRGDDEYGILLRVSSNLDFYRFSLSCNGNIRLDKYFQGKASSPYPKKLSGAVPPGAPSRSNLAVLAKGKEIRCYANDQHLFTINDPSLVQGSLGFFIRSAGENAVTISFSELAVYEVP